MVPSNRDQLHFSQSHRCGKPGDSPSSLFSSNSSFASFIPLVNIHLAAATRLSARHPRENQCFNRENSSDRSKEIQLVEEISFIESNELPVAEDMKSKSMYFLPLRQVCFHSNRPLGDRVWEYTFARSTTFHSSVNYVELDQVCQYCFVQCRDPPSDDRFSPYSSDTWINGEYIELSIADNRDESDTLLLFKSTWNSIEIQTNLDQRLLINSSNWSIDFDHR